MLVGELYTWGVHGVSVVFYLSTLTELPHPAFMCTALQPPQPVMMFLINEC